MAKRILPAGIWTVEEWYNNPDVQRLQKIQNDRRDGIKNPEDLKWFQEHFLDLAIHSPALYLTGDEIMKDCADMDRKKYGYAY